MGLTPPSAFRNLRPGLRAPFSVSASLSSGASHERIGRYEVLRKIATGGMAELFLAKQVGMEGFERVVAIKRILAHLAYDQEFINMFRDEARIVAKLSHPNIVQIYDLGKSDDTYFIAMEYIPGRNLSSVAKKARALGEKLPPTHIARCVAQACEGLHYAHTRSDITGTPLKIVHRDVSPQNIIAAFSGTVKLVDFGIAKAATKIAHTRAGVLKGKYAYMSPEQIRGEQVDARSDLFAAGIVLYELLCGRRPFEKDNSIQTLKSIVQEPHVDCREYNSDIPDALADIINGALEKDRNKRYQNAQDLQIALEDFVSTAPQRINNLTISNWITKLFEEELSREQGGTVVFQGIGEVILPDVIEVSSDDPASISVDEVEAPPPEELQAPSVESQVEVDRPLPLTRGRGGGSVDVRPPIVAPSASLEPQEPERHSLIEEGVINRPVEVREGGYDDDATVMGAPEPEPPAEEPYSDDRTEFAPGPVTAGPPQIVNPSEIRGASHVRTEVPAAPAPPPIVSPSRPDSAADLLQPLSAVAGDDDFDHADDSWDEATVGFTGVQIPADSGSSPVSSSDQSFELERVDSVADGDWGELSDEDFDADATIAGLPEAWDDPTAGGRPLPVDDSTAHPVVQSPRDFDNSEPLDIDLSEPEPAEANGLTQPLAEVSDAVVDATIAVPSITDEMIERHASQFGRGLASTQEVLDDDIEVLDFDELAPEGPESDWPADATIAGEPPLGNVVGLDPDDDFEVDISADDDDDVIPGFEVDLGQTVRAMDEEPALPMPKSDRDMDLDARTVAGVTSDYLVAGVRPPEGAYEEEETRAPPSAPDYSIPAPAAKRGQENLGAIQLNRVSIEQDFGSEEHTEGQIESSDDHGELPGVQEDFELDFSLDDDAPPVEPSPLEEPPGAASEPELPAALPAATASAARDEYSALLAPKLPAPLNPSYQGDSPGPMAIGSTNVPPANLSLSQMLEHPSRASRSKLMAIPRGISISSASGRSASMLGRQIREVATDTPNPGLMPPPAPPPLQSLGQHPEPLVPPVLAPPPTAGARKALIGLLIATMIVLLGGLAYLAYPLIFGGASQPGLKIKTNPEGAQVYVDNALQQKTTPVTISGLKSGVTYNVRLVLEGYEPVSQPVRLPAKRLLIWRIPLKPVAKVRPAPSP